MNLEGAKVLLPNSRLKRRSPTIPAALLNTVIRYVVRRFIIANVFTHRNLVRATVLRRLCDRTLTKKTGRSWTRGRYRYIYLSPPNCSPPDICFPDPTLIRTLSPNFKTVFANFATNCNT